MSESPLYRRRNPQRTTTSALKPEVYIGGSIIELQPSHNLEALEGEGLSSFSSSPSTSSRSAESESETSPSSSSFPELEGEIAQMAGGRRLRATSQPGDSGRLAKKAKTGKGKGKMNAQDKVGNLEGIAEKAERLREHADILTSVILAGGCTVAIQVASTPSRAAKTFNIYSELLILHSSYFATLLSPTRTENEVTKSESSDTANVGSLTEESPFNPDSGPKQLLLSDVNEIEFRAFTSWLYTAEFYSSALDIGLDVELEDLWVMGAKLQSPGFQNYVLNEIRTIAAQPGEGWPTAQKARKVYVLTAGEGEQDSMLRKFTVCCIAANSPFERFEKGSEEYKDWERLFEENSRLSVDVIKAGAKKCADGNMPWDNEFKADFLAEEIPLRERWFR